MARPLLLHATVGGSGLAPVRGRVAGVLEGCRARAFWCTWPRFRWLRASVAGLALRLQLSWDLVNGAARAGRHREGSTRPPAEGPDGSGRCERGRAGEGGTGIRQREQGSRGPACLDLLSSAPRVWSTQEFRVL